MRYTRTDPIAARLSEVWAVLTDVEHWPDWTASMREIVRLDSGPLRVGSTARVRQPAGRPMVWTVTDLVHERSFTWTASTAGIRFTGFHELSPTGSGVRAVLTFTVSGPMAWLAGLLAGSRIRRYVDMEADGLKRRSEGRAAP
ncbi:SRPBCC family protein [[Mycobacterium] holstebronense]|uniref:SRPBCC family protein n=1 Tax=[Mycobacterium] holstebronense TaxID=3064288 RepID=A0ABN9N7V1_9MYCO|nr:SRPBCC family protein [Mycolicibacter sp. MU0102]CAJ1499059.1 SRPBCC family protein [Mycolicibacter sp. MU0102]